MRRSLLPMLLLLRVSHTLPIPGAAQADRPTKAGCETAVRIELQAITQPLQAEVEALIADWTAQLRPRQPSGSPRAAAVSAVPSIELLEDGGLAV